MNFSSGTIKVIGGVGALSVAAIAIGVGVDQNNKNIQHQRKLAEDKADKETLENIKQQNKDDKKNQFDRGLIGFLEDQDIAFEIFKDDSSIKLTKENFYLDPNSHNHLTIRIEALVSEKSEQLKTSKDGKVKIKILKELFKGEDWTWSCHFKFSLISSGEIANKWTLKDEDKFFNDKKDGYFDLLRKDLTKEKNTEDIAKWKKIKQEFIKNCAVFSDGNKSPDTLKPKGPNFLLRTKNNAREDKKLYFTNLFTNAKEWFGEDMILLDASGNISKVDKKGS